MTDDLDDDDWPDDEDDEPAVTICPNCRAEIYEDAEQCPACGEWITRSTHPLSGRSRWFIALGLVGMVATIAALAVIAN